MYLLPDAKEGKVMVGRFEIIKQSEGSIWIQNDDEGGSFPENLLEKAILEFYNKQF